MVMGAVIVKIEVDFDRIDPTRPQHPASGEDDQE
jgi:hypothetical protein